MKLLTILFFCLATTTAAFASPGAHGPNGEHLDAPGGQVRTDAGRRIETFTESFELVGALQGGELSLLIDRYETNEPVLNGTLEVEFNGLTASAKFHADHGDYAVDDAKFIEALSRPGKHALVFTLTAGNESDLLEGTLEVKGDAVGAGQGHGHSHGDEHGHEHVSAFSLTTWAIGATLLTILLAALAIRAARRTPNSGA